MAARKSPRKTAIAQIHIAKKQLGLDDDTYRATLDAAVGKSSCSDMDIGELYKVIAHLKKCGFKTRKPSHGKRPNPTKSRTALMGKIEALLADRGLHWNYAHGMAKRMFSVEKVDWLDADQLWRVVAALEMHAKR